MKTMIQNRLKTMSYCLLLTLLTLAASASYAVVTSTLISEDFSSATVGTFPPANWSTDGVGNFHGSANGVDKGTGDAGVNGSAMFDMYNACDYSFSDHLYSPQVDASAYNTAGASVTLDLDYWMEQNGYDFFNGGNHFVIYVNDGQGNQQQLDELWSNIDFTFDNSGDFNNDYFDPLSDPTLWRHKQYVIPASYCTSTMSFVFFGEVWNTCQGGNFGMDNVVVVGTLPQNISFLPATLDFGSGAIGMQTLPQCVTLTNPSPADVTINSIQITGASASEYQFSGPVPDFIPANGTADVCLTFTPQGSGPQPADLLISNTSDNNPAIDVPLNGAGATPLIEIDPIGTKNTSTTLFKSTSTRIGDTLLQSLLIKNIGAGNLVIDPGTNIGGESLNQYSISRIPVNPILPGETDTLTVMFTPHLEGSDPAQLFILSNAGNPIDPVDLLGVGIIPRMVVTPTILLFDSVGIGDKVCKSITISNPGSDTLILRNNFLSSNDGDFTLIALNAEQSIIPPGASADVAVCFTPRQRGSRQARFTVSANIPMTFDIPGQDTAFISVDIAGTGIPFGNLYIATPTGTSNSDSAVVGTQVCVTDTITNIGQADMTITDATISGNQASEFTISGLPLPMFLQAGSSVTVTVCATPAQRGLRTGILTISGLSNEKTESASIPLDVFGQLACASPNPLTLFNAVKVLENALDTESVVITNCGDLPATYAGGVSGEGYSILDPVGGLTGVIAPGGTATFVVLFNPTTTGVKNGTLLITSANVANMNIPLTGEGACAALTEETPTVPQTGVGGSNTFDVTINNTGNFDWTPGTAVMTPSDVYTVISVTPSPIPAGGTGDVKIQFSPKVLGLATAELTFPNSGPCQDANVVVDLSGEGVVSSVKQTVSENGFSLMQNYPNPFTTTTTFNYTIPNESVVRITLSDMTGKVVKLLVSGAVSEGDHSVTFDAMQLSSGTYIYTLESGSTRLSKSLVLSK